jgi:putative serine protease PepD
MTSQFDPENAIRTAGQEPTFVPIVTKRRGPGITATVLIAVVTALVVGNIAGFGGYLLGKREADSSSTAAIQNQDSPQPTSTNLSPTQLAPAPADSIAGIVNEVLPTVVSILAEGKTQEGSGSGFVFRSDGYILTNNHVVDLIKNSGNLSVILTDGTRLKGEVVGTNPAYDLAVVRVNKTNLPAATLGNSDVLRVGDPAIAIGAPLGLAGTVTSGIISALNRPVTTGETATASFIDAIQTDAAINPGNSGGPLLNASGQVIGINSAIATMVNGSEAGSIGLGFAIPVNSAKRIAEEIIATGTSQTPIIGVSLDTNYAGPGAKIIKITEGGPADTAGLKLQDVITKIDGRVIDDATELVVAIRENAPDDQVKVTYKRQGSTNTATITLGSSSAKP